MRKEGKRKALAALVCGSMLTVALVGGSLAYLTSEDSDVNVMTLGNVSIEQHEYERVQKADGTYEMVSSEKYGEGYKLQDFTQAKPLYPATGAITGWGTKVPFDQIDKDKASGAQAVFAGLNNVQDKFVLVENTGKSDAYVRTLIALEYGSNTKDIIGISTGDFWTWNDLGVVEIDGNNYYLFEAVYKGSDTRHVGGILPAGEYTYNSLGQIYLSSEATNEDVEALDGNGNGTYDILVFSQAVQTEGFADAQTALDAAFGDITTTNHPWVEGVTLPVLVEDAQGLKDAMLVRGANIVLTEDVVVDKDTPLQWGAYMFVANGREVTIDLNGKSIVVEGDASLKTNGLFTTANGGTLNIVGDGTVEVKNGRSGIFHAMNKNDQINVYGGTYISNSNNGSDALAIIYTNSGSVDVYGGKFCSPIGVTQANAEDTQGERLCVMFHEGTLMNHAKYYEGYDATRIQLEEGCVLEEIVIDGVTWHQVVKE